MKTLFYLIFFFALISCTNYKNTYWCGDHPCINKKEKEAYFKKTMIVEIKKTKKNTSKDNSSIEKIIQQTKKEEKRRIKEEKSLAREVKRDEKKVTKKKKINSSQSIDNKADIENIPISVSSFKKLVEKITKRNSLKPYPNINDIPN